MNRPQANADGYENEAQRFLQADMSAVPIIKGIQEYERCLLYHQEAHKLDASERIKSLIADKLRQLE